MVMMVMEEWWMEIEEIKLVVLMVKMVGKMAILVMTMVVMKVMEEWWMEIELCKIRFVPPPKEVSPQITSANAQNPDYMKTLEHCYCSSCNFRNEST